MDTHLCVHRETISSVSVIQITFRNILIAHLMLLLLLFNLVGLFLVIVVPIFIFY